jgi:hypothetical protein
MGMAPTGERGRVVMGKSENLLSQAMSDAPWFRDKIRNSDEYARDVYRALCNNIFYELADTSNRWSCSWRSAGSLVAHIRGSGDYMDWYLSEDEGTISPEVALDLCVLGWSKVPMMNYDNPEWEVAQNSDHTTQINLREKINPNYGFRIALVGNAGSGKDTVSDFLSEMFPDIFRVAFADDLKTMTSQMLNTIGYDNNLHKIYFPVWDLKRINDHRDALRPIWQWVGTDLIRKHYPNYWINRVAVKINSNSFIRRIVLTDCRFENEAEWARHNGFLVVRLSGRSRDVPDHESERQIASLPADLEYVNDGSLEDLKLWVVRVLVPKLNFLRLDDEGSALP